MNTYDTRERVSLNAARKLVITVYSTVHIHRHTVPTVVQYSSPWISASNRLASAIVCAMRCPDIINIL